MCQVFVKCMSSMSSVDQVCQVFVKFVSTVTSIYVVAPARIQAKVRDQCFE